MSNKTFIEDNPKYRFHVIQRLNKTFLFDEYYSRIAQIPSRTSTEHVLRKLYASPDEWDNLFPRSSKPIKPIIPVKPVLPNLDDLHLIVANTCNMKCIYCVTDKGNYGNGSRCGLMDEAVAKDAVSYFINELCAKPTAKIVFYGGEPLLNWKTIKEVMQYGERIAKKKNIRIKFGLTTNGTLFTPSIVRFLARSNVGGLITIDADDQEVHDGLRPLVGGGGTFQGIIKAIKHYPQLVKIFTPRATITSRNTELLRYAKYFHSLGFETGYFGPVLSLNPKLMIRPRHMRKVDHEFEKLLRWNISQMKKTGRVFDYGFRSIIDDIINVERTRFCFGGYDTITVTHDGDIYACEGLAYRQDFKLGNIYQGIDSERHLKFLNKPPASYISKYNNCWASNYLGECYHASYCRRNSTSALKTGCEWTKSLLENALVLYYEIQKSFDVIRKKL
jgi:uncharacterized protein